MDELQILLKAIIDGDSVTSLDSQLSNIVKSLSASHEVKLKVAVDETSIRTTQSQLQSIAKQVSSAGNSGRQVQLKVFDAAQLQADGQRYFTGVRDIVSRVQKQFSKLGSVDVVNVFKDAQGDIQSFTASVTKADGVVERFNFNLSKIRHGSRTYSGFVQENSILSDKNAGTNLQKTLDYLNRIDNKIADITSRTLSNTAKPLLADMEQYNQYQTKLTQVKSRIDELRKANTTLSADHKREINSMVADLQRYARELQTSAYAATDLNAATFTNKKAELQAALQTDIQRWQNSGLFGADFKAAVNDAKRMLDEALDPTDLDAYRHQLSLLNQQFKQMKLQNTASGKILDADRLTSNIQTAQLRIQNLKNTYSSFVNDPNLLAKWQQLFDESKMISSSKELTNLNAKIRLFEQELISAGKHSRSLWDDLKANAAKMGSWMVLGGVIAGVMRGVTGLYDAVVQLDSAMTELMKVTDETDASYEAFLSDAADKAVQIGTTYADFVDSTASFARLGYNMEDASQLSEVANIYAVVGDEVDGIEGATNSIISTMKAFGIEVDDTMSIVDKFNEVGNRFAISSGGIGEAMMRSASAMAEANNTIDESIALIVAANNVIQDPDVVGTMWKTVSMRIRGAKTELEEAGLETEYMAETTASLRKKILGLTNVDGSGGFDIMLDEETFKSTYDIMLGISEVWEDMSDIDQAALLELLAGKRQGNALAAAITNMGDAVKVMDTSLNAEGSAVREHEKWMDSIQAKQQQFQAQYEVFANTILSSDLIKGVFDAGTGLLGWLTTLVDTVGALPAVFATVMPFLDKLNLFRTTDQKNWGGSGTGIAFAWNAQKLELDNDIKLLDEYNSKIANLGTSTGDLTQRQIVWNDTIGKGSDRLRSAVKVSDDAAVSSKAYASSMEQASIKTTLMGVKSKAAAIGVQVLNTALNALIGLGIGLAINAIISGITSLVNKSKEAREAALEAGSAAVQSSTELYDLASSYLEMSYAVEAGTASQEDLMSIQDELVAYLETQGIAVQNLSGDYDTLRQSIVEAAREQMRTNISQGIRAADIAKEDAIGELETWLGGNSLYSSAKEGAKEAFDYLDSLGFSGIDTGTKGGTLVLPNSTTTDLFSDITFDQLMENYRYLEDAMNAVRDEYGSENPVFTMLADAFNTYDEALKDAIEQIDNANQMIAQDALLAAQALDQPTTVEEFEEFRSQMIQNIQNTSGFDEDGTYTAEQLADNVLGSDERYADLLAELQEREASAEAVNEKMREIAEKLVPKTYEELTPGTSAHFHALDAWSAEVECVKDKLEALSDEEFEIAYNAVINEGATTWEDITAAIEEYNSEQSVATRNAENLQRSIRGMWDSEDFSDTKEELIAMSQAVDGITPQNIEELASESSVLASILEEDGMNARFLSQIIQNMAEGGDGVSLVTAEALKLNDALDGMVDKFDQVTDAKSRYDAAMAVEEKDTDFRSYAEAFEELNAQFEAGTTNSNAFWAAAEFLFGSEQLNTWGWSDGLDEIYDAMQRNKGVFEDAESAGAGFIERLYEMSEAGQLVNDEGEKLIEISRDASGAYDFDVDPENLEEIAEKMGITEEAVIACFEALSMWGDIDFYDLTEVSEAIDEIGLSAETAAGKAINVDRLTEQLMTLGKTDKEIYDVMSALQGLDGVQLFSISGDIDSVTTSLQNLGIATSDDYTITINYEGLGDLLANLGYTKEEAEGLITKLGEADGITLANADGEVKDVSDALAYIDTITFTNVTTSINGVETAIDDVDNSTTDNAVSEIDGIGSAAEDAATKVYSIGTAIDSVNGRTATVYYNVQRKGGLLGTIGNLLGFAKGTSSAPAGEALLGDEYSPDGSPKPELVVSDGRAYLAGLNGPEIANLNAGDQVYTASETKRILSRSGKRITGTIPAYASGRITTSGLRVETDKTGSTGTPYTPTTTTTATVTVEAEVDDEQLSEEMEDAIKEIQDELDEILGNYEHDIFTLERNDGTPEEIIAVYKKMQDTVHQYAEKYRAMGLDENNDYIQDLGEQWWEYQDEIDDILHGIYSDAVEAHENTIELLQHQYDDLSDSKNYRDMSTNLERQRQEQLRIQELAHEEAQRLRALGVDENDEAIQECIDAWWDAEDDIKEINDSIVENVLEPFDEFIEYADDFDLWDRFDFTKVDYLRQKIAALNRLLEQGVLTLREYTELLRETQLDIYNEQKDAITEIIEKTMELVRQEAEDKIDALEEQIDDYQKIIDLKKESLEVARDEEDYEREVAERVAEIAKVQEKINQLSRDDSREANAERQQLEQELAELQNDLADYQADYAYDAQVDALDKEADKFEETKDNEIAKVEASVDTEEEVYRAAIDRINADWDQLYQDLIAWNRQYGDMIDGEDSITSAWQTAMQAAQEYGDIVSALNGINNDIANEQQGILDQQQEDAEISAIMSEMYANGQAWGSASDEEKQRLADENLRLGRLLAPYGINAVRGDDGVWYVDRVGGEQLFQKYRQYIYHDGGIVGEDSLKSNEVFAKLQKGEAVFTSKQYKNLFSQIGDTITGVVDSVVRSLATAKDTTAAAIQSVTNNENTDNSMGEIRIENHFEVKNADEKSARELAEYYSDRTIDKLMTAAKRKGMKNSIGSHMLR